jgi:hypothetical protein
MEKKFSPWAKNFLGFIPPSEKLSKRTLGKKWGVFPYACTLSSNETRRDLLIYLKVKGIK